MMKELVLGIWLGILGIVDFKYKEIPLWFSVLMGVIGLGFHIVEKSTWEGLLLSCVPGVLALCFSKITREVMGYGDGIVLLVMGIYLSFEQLVSIGMIAFGVAGIVALILLIFFRKKGKDRIPFIPFLFSAYVMDYLSHMEGLKL